jgi:PAS domain S-box-containing protein
VNVNSSRESINVPSNEDAALLLSAIVDSSDDAIISKDLNGIITSWNRSAERLFGYTAAEAVGQPVASLLIPADRQEEEPEILSRLRRGERVDHFETKRKRKDGTILDISLTISPVKDAKGNIVGASKIARDVTEQLRTREELQKANRQLAQSNADLEYFAYSASHDLQEPLRMISAYSAMLRRKYGNQLDQEANQYLNYLTEGIARMERLLRDLREFTHVSTNTGPAPEVDANVVLRETLANLKVVLEENRAEVISGRLPTVCLHEFQLEQLFQNIIGNAIHYRSDAAPRININAEPDGDVWRFSIQDNGMGIADRYRRKSLECSNAFTQLQIIQGRVWDLRSASVLLSGVEGASGWNLNWDEVRRSSLPFPQHNNAQLISRTDSVYICSTAKRK